MAARVVGETVVTAGTVVEVVPGVIGGSIATAVDEAARALTEPSVLVSVTMTVTKKPISPVVNE